MKEITVKEFDALRKEQRPYQLIDVREKWEYEQSNLGGTLLPMGDLAAIADQIDTTKMVILHCYRGARSQQVIKALESTYHCKDLYNLKGGLLAYAKEIDPGLNTY